VRGRCGLRAGAVVVVATRQQHAELAESGNQECAGEVQESPEAFRIPISQDPKAKEAPPDPVLPATSAIPGVLAAGQAWKVVWSWEGNNVDGPIAGDNGTVLFANNDASNVMQMDPATGLAKVVYSNVNTGGAVARSKNGALFVAERGLGSAIEQLEPQRKILANSWNGEPLECVGGVVNDLVADGARRRLFFGDRRHGQRSVLCRLERRSDAVRQGCAARQRHHS